MPHTLYTPGAAIVFDPRETFDEVLDNLEAWVPKGAAYALRQTDGAMWFGVRLSEGYTRYATPEEVGQAAHGALHALLGQHRLTDLVTLDLLCEPWIQSATPDHTVTYGSPYVSMFDELGL
jgi:hypothetical protein